MSPSINLVHLNSLVFTQNSIRILYRVPPLGSSDAYNKQSKFHNVTFTVHVCQVIIYKLIRHYGLLYVHSAGSICR